MNERMRELAEKAGYLPDMFGFGHWDMPECKKFAELIVLECASVYDAIDNGNKVEDTEDYMLALKRRFKEE